VFDIHLFLEDCVSPWDARGAACPKTYDSQSNSFFFPKLTEFSVLQAKAGVTGQPLTALAESLFDARRVGLAEFGKRKQANPFPFSVLSFACRVTA
jgi:hypothetical protein